MVIGRFTTWVEFDEYLYGQGNKTQQEVDLYLANFVLKNKKNYADI